MTFEFRAHHPSAYYRFGIVLIILITINLFFISFFFPQLKTMNEAVSNSIVLIVPWLLILLLPSVVFGILIYRSFVKTFRFTIEENLFAVELLKKNGYKKEFAWDDLKSLRIVDFEDNHYCNLEFNDKKNNLVIHRESGEFEKFYAELLKYSKIEPAALSQPFQL
ncbi:MAG: hypothetical protein LH473_02175 [Chitinophagales bacterium]|nr:hypothetical protein [Chitinophagales bacterium]